MEKKLRVLGYFEGRITLKPLIKDIKRYSFKLFRDDIFAAFSVALLALPQSIAYSLLANLPPMAGVFSAIFGSIFTGALGSSRHLVAGPSTGVSILIQTTVMNILFTYFPQVSGIEKDLLAMSVLTQIVLLMGLIQIVLGFFNLGKMLQFVSRSVILGYFAGVGIAIIINQLFYLLGIKTYSFAKTIIVKAFFLTKHLGDINWITLSVGILSILILVMLKKKYKKFPNALLMLVVITLLVYGLDNFLEIDKYKVLLLNDMGMSEISKMKLILPGLSFQMISQIFFPSLAIAMLAILEVFSISRGIAALSTQRIRSNQQIFALGVSNVVLSFFYQAMPSSGSISRSTLNYQSGAKSRFAAVFSGLFVAIFIFLLWPFVKLIPLCALSALLIVIVPSIVDIKDVKLCFRATKGDGFVFLLTMVSCIIFSLDVAFFIGIIISIVFYLNRAAVPHLVEYAFDSKGRLKVMRPKKYVHRRIRIIGIAGELFFAAVDLVQDTLRKVAKDPYVKVIILRLNNVYHVDASMCFAILRLHDYLKSTDRHLIISGVTDEVWEIFLKARVVKKLQEDNIFLSDETKPQLSTFRACMRAQEFI